MKENGVSQWLEEVEQSREATGDHPAWSAAFRSRAFPETDLSVNGFQTVHELWKNTYLRNKNNPCLGVGSEGAGPKGGEPYFFQNYQQVHLHVASLAGSLLNKVVVTEDREGDIKEAKGPHVGIFGGNCPAWLITFLACARSGRPSVPMSDSLGLEAIEFVIKDAEIDIVVVSTELAGRLVSAIERLEGDHNVQYVVMWGGGLPAYDEAMVKLDEAGIETFLLEDLINIGEDFRFEVCPPAPEDTCAIMYTGGSSGQPKGVKLTHDALVHNVAAMSTFFEKQGCAVGAEDSYLSYLPLAHIFVLTFEVWLLHSGARIGYYRGDQGKVVSDAKALKPTIFIGMPRVLDEICDAIRKEVRSLGFLHRMLWRWSYSRKRAFLRGGIAAADASPMFDDWYRPQTHGLLGGKQRIIISGAAHLSFHNEELLRVAMSCPVVQAYVLTETTPVACMAVPDALEHIGTIGVPMPATYVRIESVPELGLNALAESPVGEVLVKSLYNQSVNYTNSAQKAAVDGEGWFHTGDIGVLQNGVLKLVDKKESMFKMSHGECIRFEAIETAGRQCPMVEQIWVYGDGSKSDLVAVVVPSSSELTAWAQDNKLPGNFDDLCQSPLARSHVRDCLQSWWKKDAKLSNTESIMSVYLEPMAFSEQDGLLTPTAKLRRSMLLGKYEKEIETLYERLNVEGERT